MAKKSRRPLGKELNMGTFEDYVIKRIDVEQRLANCFCLFIKAPDGGYFLSGGQEKPEKYISPNFTAICMGATRIESTIGFDLLVQLGSTIARQFDEQDFHSTIVLDFLCTYMKEQLEDVKSPRALALEFIIFDHITNKLFRILFDGDYQIDDLEEAGSKFFIIGDYDKPNKEGGMFLNILTKSIGDNVSVENISEVANLFKKRSGLSVSLYIEKEIEEKSDS